MSAVLKSIMSSESVEWGTPSRYIEAARMVMGQIDLDPASCDAANRTVRAARYFSELMDGLKQLWRAETVFLNPPYGKTGNRSNQDIWAEKLIMEYKFGEIKQAILLVNACTSERWFQPLWVFPICLTNHRIKFNDLNGSGRTQPTKGSAFVYLAPNDGTFVEHFQQFGPIVKAHWLWQ